MQDRTKPHGQHGKEDDHLPRSLKRLHGEGAASKDGGAETGTLRRPRGRRTHHIETTGTPPGIEARTQVHGRPASADAIACRSRDRRSRVGTRSSDRERHGEGKEPRRCKGIEGGRARSAAGTRRDPGRTGRTWNERHGRRSTRGCRCRTVSDWRLCVE